MIYFISNNKKDFEKRLLQFAEAHSLEFETYITIEDFLSVSQENIPKQQPIKYEDFEKWMGRFHLVLGCWDTKREWREARQQLVTLEPRVAGRLKSSWECLEKRIRNIFRAGVADAMSEGQIKNAFMPEMKSEFRGILAENFHTCWKGPAACAKKEKTLSIEGTVAETMNTALRNERLKLVSAISEIFDKKKSEANRIQLRKIFPERSLTRDNENVLRYSDKWWSNFLKKCSLKPLDYLIFFDHCPWCLSQNIEMDFFKTPGITWVDWPCGRAAWIVKCAGCGEVLIADLLLMS